MSLAMAEVELATLPVGSKTNSEWRLKLWQLSVSNDFEAYSH